MTTCRAVFDMDAKMGDLVPDLKFRVDASNVDNVPDWVAPTREIQGRLCPDDPHFGYAYARLGNYGADMKVHPHLQKFTADIRFGDRFSDDEPIPAVDADGKPTVRQMWRLGFKHMLDLEGFQAQADARRARRASFATASQDPGEIDTNDPHRQIFVAQFLRDDTGVWIAAAAHPSTTFADYRRAIGSDVSGDYHGIMENGRPKWWVAFASIVGYGATENTPSFAAAASHSGLWAFGASEPVAAVPQAPAPCSCDVDPVSVSDELVTVTAERDMLAEQLADVQRGNAETAAASARTVLEAQAALDWNSELARLSNHDT